MVLTRNLLLCGLAVFCFASLPSAEAQDSFIVLDGAERGPEGHEHGHGHRGPEGHRHHDAHGPSRGPQPCASAKHLGVACPPARPCRDATICVRPTSRPCYTPEGVNAFVALFRDAAEKGVENAAIRAFNSTRVAPAAPQAGPPASRPAAKCPHCQKSECKGGCKKPACEGKTCEKKECKECEKKK